MTNHLKEWMGKGFWFLFTSLCGAMVDMLVGGICYINSLCFKNGKIGIRLFIRFSLCLYVCVYISVYANRSSDCCFQSILRGFFH